jgi:hypothetical protein
VHSPRGTSICNLELCKVAHSFLLLIIESFVVKKTSLDKFVTSSLNNGRHIVCTAGIVLIQNLANEPNDFATVNACTRAFVQSNATFLSWACAADRPNRHAHLYVSYISENFLTRIGVAAPPRICPPHPTPPCRTPFLTPHAVTIPPPRRGALPAAPHSVPRKQTTLDNCGRAAAGPHRWA